MSEKRFTVESGLIIDTDNDDCLCDIQDTEIIVNTLNAWNKLIGEQLATICKLQDLCGESDSENAKLRIENNEQQSTISKLEEEKGYWKSKAMTLLMQVRRLTPRMTDKEVMEFSKELEDE